jgi:hypothetical protein
MHKHYLQQELGDVLLGRLYDHSWHLTVAVDQDTT